MEDSGDIIEKVYFYFPPDKTDIPPSDFKKIILDLPQLSIEHKKFNYIDENDNGKNFRIELKGKEPVKSELLLNLVKEHYEKIPKQQFEYSKIDYYKLNRKFETSWMTDATGSLIIKWLELLMSDEMKKRCMLLNSLSVNTLKDEFNHFEDNATWKFDVELANLDVNKNKALKQPELFEKYRKCFHVGKQDNSIPECILMLHNIPIHHWNLVCLCNLNTVEKSVGY